MRVGRVIVVLRVEVVLEVENQEEANQGRGPNRLEEMAPPVAGVLLMLPVVQAVVMEGGERLVAW